jgi:cytochrome c556
MLRKWLVFAASAAVLITLGVLAAPRFTRAADDETPLGKIMEKVNKADVAIRKFTRSEVLYRKGSKDVEKHAKEIVKLAKEAKVIKDALKRAKNVADPAKKWDEYMDELIKTTEKLEKESAKPAPVYLNAKNAYSAVKKACADCHNDFRVEEGSF